MPEEATSAPAENEDTPAAVTEAPEEGTPSDESTEDSTPAIDYEQRYNDLRPEFDRKNQLLAAAEGHQGPQAQAAALRQLGVEVALEEEEQEQDDDEWVDPDDRIDALEQKLAQREEAEQEAHFQRLEEQFIDSTLKGIEGDENVTLTDAETELIVNNALANRLEDGTPNLKGAYDALKGIKSAARDEYLASKKNAPKAPVGTAGVDAIDPHDKEARNKAMAEEFEARMAADE